MDLDLAARRLEAIGNPTRLRLYLTLLEAGTTGMAVGTLQHRLGLRASSTLSHHLRRMIEAGVVKQERAVTTLICTAEPDALHEALALLAPVLPSSTVVGTGRPAAHRGIQPDASSV